METKDRTDNNDNNPKKEAWLAHVQLLTTLRNRPQKYCTTAAVWAHSHDDFDAALRYHMVSHDLKLLHTYQVMPAVEWLHQNLADEKVKRLAHSVHRTWPIAFGDLVAVEGGAG